MADLLAPDLDIFSRQSAQRETVQPVKCKHVVIARKHASGHSISGARLGRRFEQIGVGDVRYSFLMHELSIDVYR